MGKILAAKGFYSHRLIEKGLVGNSVLPSPNRKNPSSIAYRHNPLNGENLTRGKTDSEWGKSQQRVVSSGANSISGMSIHSPPCGYPISRRTYSEWEKSQQQSSFRIGKIPSTEHLAWKDCKG